MKTKHKKHVQPVPAAQNMETAFFYFGRKNAMWMGIGFLVILLGFALMMGPDANTVDGQYNPNVWNEAIFSVRRIRIAPLVVVAGFVIEIYAILKNFKAGQN